jgi:hypothetical protein
MTNRAAALVAAVVLGAVLASVAGCKVTRARPTEASGAGWVPAADGAPQPQSEPKGLAQEPVTVELPATSSPSRLAPFEVKGRTEHETGLDPDAISLGADGVTRYTLVVRTTAGVANVTYEGIRCETAEWKVYATGRQDGQWHRVPVPVWRPMDKAGLNDIRQTLYERHVCTPARTVPVSVAQVLQSFRRPHPVGNR